MRVVSAFVIAFSTYSRLPMPRVKWTDENRKYAMCFFPLIGAVIGLCLAAWLYICDRFALGGLLRGAVGAVLPLVITGGIHMDGFMDTADALASWQPKEKRLEILKDSHTGAFAVIGCASYLLVMAGALGEAAFEDAALLGPCFVVSRALSAAALTVFRSARPQGMLDGFARVAHQRAVCAASAFYLLICLSVWIGFGGVTGTLCMAAAGVCVAVYGRMAYGCFGGVTGDLAGWFVQVTEIACILTAMLGRKIL